MNPLFPSPLGSTERLTLHHRDGAEFDVLSGRGGALVGWRVPGVPQDLLDGYADEADLTARYHSSHCGARLSPFPNRVCDGHWRWRGKDYQLPKNFPWENGHAIHGLLFDLHWRQIGLKSEGDAVWMTLRCDYDGSDPGFPMAFQAESCYGLYAQGFEVVSRIRNTGSEDLPCGEGWHPYFRPGCRIDRAELQFSSLVSRVELDDRSIPTGQMTQDNDFAQPVVLGKRNLNTCWLYSGKEPRFEVRLRNPATGFTLRYWQDAQVYPYLQLYTPPTRESLAIEPMSCPADVLNNHKNLLELRPGETQEWRFGAMVDGI
ncbi:MAG TPA: hypothetical protein VLM37_12880 [Fibrobacteraceae bacterium]|nr:hypothetical protein [Fibrobacteraceae bacterium]